MVYGLGFKGLEGSRAGAGGENKAALRNAYRLRSLHSSNRVTHDLWPGCLDKGADWE